ncbi:hypothetical protein [Enterobacter bugandensis]|uniref:hypothetical protein n=1 Tax=Enterobacter bugandensis TaxID=881260 RepID=UPI00300C2132
MINNFICNKEKNELHWIYNTHKVTIGIDDLDLAMIDEKRKIIFVLSKPLPLPMLLTVLNIDGTLLSTFTPPEGASFSYLTLNDKKEVLIVCSFSAKINGWYDWHYSLDLNKKVITRMAPSY